jgi:methionyl-tRNA formyltransferase
MRFAITGVDRSLSVFEALMAAGWEPVKLFTVPPNLSTDLNRVLIDRAMGLNIPVQLSRMDEADLADLGARGCEVLVCASYNWRIGAWRPHVRFAVNFHASPLPEARGPYPAFRAILEGRMSWGVTCHKLEHGFDAGDVLAVETFPLSEAECHDSLDLKTQMASGRLARRVAADLPGLWDRAARQGPGSYWRLTGDDERTLDFTGPVEAVMRQVRAFGLTETIAHVNGRTVYVRRAVGWTEAHGHAPGCVVHADGRRSVVAARDGYIALIEWSPIPLPAVEAVGRDASAPVTRR